MNPLNIPEGAGIDRKKYSSRKLRTLKGYQYQAKSLLMFAGVETPEKITQADVDRFREEDMALSNVSIEAAIKSVGILSGRTFKGDKLKIRHRAPKLVSLHDLSKTYAVARGRQNCQISRFLKWSYITGLRLSDLLTLKRDQMDQPIIQIEAQKTGKLHLIPRHPILNVRLPEKDYPLYRGQKSLRNRLKYYCEIAGVPYFTPQMIRRTAANEYEKAHAGAGGVLLGHDLGSVTWRYYLDQVEKLRKAQDRLAIPESMIPGILKDSQRLRKRRMNEAFQELDEEMQTALLKIAQSMKP